MATLGLPCGHPRATLWPPSGYPPRCEGGHIKACNSGHFHQTGPPSPSRSPFRRRRFDPALLSDVGSAGRARTQRLPNHVDERCNGWFGSRVHRSRCSPISQYTFHLFAALPAWPWTARTPSRDGNEKRRKSWCGRPRPPRPGTPGGHTAGIKGALTKRPPRRNRNHRSAEEGPTRCLPGVPGRGGRGRPHHDFGAFRFRLGRGYVRSKAAAPKRRLNR